MVVTVGVDGPDALSLTLAVTRAFVSPRRNVGGVGHMTPGSARSTSSGVEASLALFPAASVAVPLTVCGCALSPSVTGAVQLTTPEVESAQEKVTVGAVTYQPPAPSGVAGMTVCVIAGATVSRLTVIERSARRPAPFVEAQVNVVPLVSVVTVVAPQPVELATPLSASETIQLRETSLVYHPFDPSAPSTCGSICGGVMSAGVALRGSVIARSVVSCGSVSLNGNSPLVAGGLTLMVTAGANS